MITKYILYLFFVFFLFDLKKILLIFCDTLITMMISSSRLDQFPSIQSRNSILSPTPLHFKVKISRTNKKKTENRYEVYFVIIFGKILSKENAFYFSCKIKSMWLMTLLYCLHPQKVPNELRQPLRHTWLFWTVEKRKLNNHDLELGFSRWCWKGKF